MRIRFRVPGWSRRSCCGRYSRDSGVALPQYHVSTYHYQRPACREAHAEPRAARAAWRALYLCAASSALFRLMRGCRDQVHYGLCFPGASLRISLLFIRSHSSNRRALHNSVRWKSPPADLALWRRDQAGETASRETATGSAMLLRRLRIQASLRQAAPVQRSVWASPRLQRALRHASQA